ncbi:hypothetical protein [Limnobacter sp.]|uniref:DUF7673 family protein n=1 Tax=Limnobacter sp. TaxID=2003368 RepID=UPI003748C9DB
MQKRQDALTSATKRCVEIALGSSDQAKQMRSVLLTIHDPITWPLDLASIKVLEDNAKKDAFLLITWFISIRSRERILDLIENGDQIAEQLAKEETHAVMNTAIEGTTWPTGYWKNCGKEAMQYRFGATIVEAFDNTLLMNYLRLKNDSNLDASCNMYKI